MLEPLVHHDLGSEHRQQTRPDAVGLGMGALGVAKGLQRWIALVALIGCRSNDLAGANFSAWTNANLANLTERFDNGSTTGNGGGVGMATGENATPDAVGTTSATTSNAMRQGWVIAIRPATGTAYDAVLDTDSPVAHWKLEEASGTTAVDRKGSAHLTYEGGAGVTVAKMAK